MRSKPPKRPVRSDAVADMMLARKTGVPPKAARAFIRADEAEDKKRVGPPRPTRRGR